MCHHILYGRAFSRGTTMNTIIIIGAPYSTVVHGLVIISRYWSSTLESSAGRRERARRRFYQNSTKRRSMRWLPAGWAWTSALDTSDLNRTKAWESCEIHILQALVNCKNHEENSLTRASSPEHQVFEVMKVMNVMKERHRTGASRRCQTGRIACNRRPCTRRMVNIVLGCSKHGPEPTDIPVEDAMSTTFTHHGDAQVSLRKV